MEVKKILIIEDEETLLRVLSDKMEKSNFEVSSVSDGNLAFDEVKKQKPDLILLDLMLPNVSGETVLKKIRENDSTKDIPVIVLSAKADDATVINCLENLGAEDYMVKSDFTLEQVIDKINKYI